MTKTDFGKKLGIIWITFYIEVVMKINLIISDVNLLESSIGIL